MWPRICALLLPLTAQALVTPTTPPTQTPSSSASPSALPQCGAPGCPVGFPCDLRSSLLSLGVQAVPPSGYPGGYFPSCPSSPVAQCMNYMGAMTCASKACDVATSTCQAPFCGDNYQNGWETGVDCGGECAPCADAGSPCNAPFDCDSNICSFEDELESRASAVAVSSVPGGGGRCAANSSTDFVENGQEADVDCGGALCTAYEKRALCPNICVAGMACQRNDDCRNLVCNTQDQEFDNRTDSNPQFCMAPLLSSSNPDIAARVRSGVILPLATKVSLFRPLDQTLVAVRDIDRLLKSVGLLIDVPREQFQVDVVVEEKRPREMGPGSFADVRVCRGGGFQRGPYNDTRDGWSARWGSVVPFAAPRSVQRPPRVVRQEGRAAARDARGGWDTQRGVFDLRVVDSPGIPPPPCLAPDAGAPFVAFNMSVNDLVVATRVRWVTYVGQYESQLLLERLRRLLDIRVLPGGWTVEREVLRELDWITQDAEYCFWFGRNYTFQAFNMSGVDCSVFLNCTTAGTWPGAPELLPLWGAPQVEPLQRLYDNLTISSRYTYDSARNVTELTQCFSPAAAGGARSFPALYSRDENTVQETGALALGRRARALAGAAGGVGPPIPVDPAMATLCAAAVPASALHFNRGDSCAAPIGCSSALYTCAGSLSNCSSGAAGWSNAFSCAGGCASGACPITCAASPLAPAAGPPYTHVMVVNDKVFVGAGGAVNRTTCAFPLLSNTSLTDDGLCWAFSVTNTRFYPNNTWDAYGVPSLACDYKLNCTTQTAPLADALAAFPPLPPLRLVAPGVAATVRAWANFPGGGTPTMSRSECYYPTTPPFTAVLSPFSVNTAWVRTAYVRNRLREWVRWRCFPLWAAVNATAARAADPEAAFRCNSRMGRGNQRTSDDYILAPSRTTFDADILTEVPRVDLKLLLEESGLVYDNATGPLFLAPGASFDVSTCGEGSTSCNRGEPATPTAVFTPAFLNVVVEPRGTPDAPLFRDHVVPIAPVVEMVDRHGRHVSKWEGDMVINLFIDKAIWPAVWFVDGTPSPSPSSQPYGANSFYEEAYVKQLQLFPEGMFYQLVPKALQVFGVTAQKLDPQSGFATFNKITLTRAVKGLFLNFSVKYKLQTLVGATRPFDVLVPYPTPLVLVSRYILPPGAVAFFIIVSIIAVYVAARQGVTRLRRARLPSKADGGKNKVPPDLEGLRAVRSDGGAVLYTPDFAKFIYAPFRYIAGMMPTAVRDAAVAVGASTSSYNPNTHPNPAWVAEQMERRTNARLVPQLTVADGLRQVGPLPLKAFDAALKKSLALGRPAALGTGGGGGEEAQSTISTVLGPLLLSREPSEIEAERLAAAAAAAAEAAKRADEESGKLTLRVAGRELNVQLPPVLKSARKAVAAKMSTAASAAGVDGGASGAGGVEPVGKPTRKPFRFEEALNDAFLRLHARFMPPLPGLDPVHKLPIPQRSLVTIELDNADVKDQTAKHLADWEAASRARAAGLQKSVTVASTRTKPAVGAVKGALQKEEVVEPEPDDLGKAAVKLGGGGTRSARALPVPSEGSAATPAPSARTLSKASGGDPSKVSVGAGSFPSARAPGEGSAATPAPSARTLSKASGGDPSKVSVVGAGSFPSARISEAGKSSSGSAAAPALPGSVRRE